MKLGRSTRAINNINALPIKKRREMRVMSRKIALPLKKRKHYREAIQCRSSAGRNAVQRLAVSTKDSHETALKKQTLGQNERDIERSSVAGTSMITSHDITLGKLTRVMAEVSSECSSVAQITRMLFSLSIHKT